MGTFKCLKNTIKYELALLKVTFGGFLRNPRPNEYIAQIDQHTAIIYNKGLYGFIHNGNYIQCPLDYVLYVSGKYYAVKFGTNLESDHGVEIIPTKQIENPITIFIFKNTVKYHIIFLQSDIYVFNYSIPNMMLGITSDGRYMGFSEETLEFIECQKFDQKTSRLKPDDYIYEGTNFIVSGCKYTVARGSGVFEQLLLDYNNYYSIYSCGGIYILAITCAKNEVWASQLYKEILRIKPAIH
jgi:hypothetical protein